MPSANILIVDDTPFNNEVLKIGLSAQGYHIDTAISAAAARPAGRPSRRSPRPYMQATPATENPTLTSRATTCDSPANRHSTPVSHCSSGGPQG